MASQQPVGVKEIARMANVSIATVDRVLHNRPGVSASTKKKIDALLKKYNYQPNILARRLASRKILKFATLIPSVSSETPYWQLPLNGILQAESDLRQFGITIEKYFFDLNNDTTFSDQAKKIAKNKVDGVLLAPNFRKDAEVFAKTLDQKRIPYVFINSDVSDQNNTCYIGPHLYQSGYLGGQLADFICPEGKNFLIVNISKVPDSYYYLLKKEEGFRSYFDDHRKVTILKSDIQKTDYKSIKKELSFILKVNDINLIFVTNSRVFYVAKFLEEEKITNTKLIGFDFLSNNISYLENGVIDMLISQKPQEQGYRGVMALYNKLVKSEDLEKQQYMPIDIITKENYKFYSN